MSAVQLSSREKEILKLTSTGLTAQQIADRLSLSLDTVETHKRNTLRKLNAKNTTEAVAKAIKMKLILNNGK